MTVRSRRLFAHHGRVEPEAFYTGLVAELYAPLRQHTQDPEPYARFIGGSGQPALELGCGDGDPLLALRARGLDVHGVDSSADMLRRCRQAAAAQNLPVHLHHQRMQDLALEQQYRSIFLAGPSFTLLPDDQAALATLSRIRQHLHPGGTALIPLFIPEPTPAEQLGRVRQATAADGAQLRVQLLAAERDEAARSQHTVLRYERTGAQGTTSTERTWTLHWYTQEIFTGMANRAGLSATLVDIPGAGPSSATDFAFHCTPA